MKNFILAFIIFIFWALLSLWIYSWLVPNHVAATNPQSSIENESTPDLKIGLELNDTKDQPTKEKINTDSSTLQVLNDAGEMIFSFDEGINIIKSSDELIYSPSLDFSSKISNYLIQNPDQGVRIISYYSPTENFETPNFGIKRGTKVKDILIRNGVASLNIEIKPMIKELEFDENDIFHNAISFQFFPQHGKKSDEVDISSLNKIVYPRFSNNGILVNSELKELIGYIKEVVADHPDVMIEVIGHTDNVGSGIDNYQLGLEYAKQVRWFLVSKGNIDRNRIKALSKGEEQPIDTNSSERGKNANRRIEIVFL